MKKENYKEDISETKKLVSAFVKKYGSVFGLNEKQMLSNVVAKTFLGRGANVFTTFSVSSNITKLGVGDAQPKSGYLWLGSDINPNGVTSKDDVARTYTIHLELKGKRRTTLRRTEENSIYFKVYEYGTSVENAIEKASERFDLLDKKIKSDDLKFSEIVYDFDKYDNGGGVAASSKINKDSVGIGTGADLNVDQYEKGGNTPSKFEYSIGGL